MAARTRYAPDRGLTVRMTATMFLLGLVFVAFVAAIIGIGTAYGASSTAIVFFAVILGGGFAIGSLFYSDKIALATAGAQRGKPDRLTGSRAPARHRGPALRAGRHAQAAGRDRRHRHAERVRDRPQRRPRGGLRDQGDHAPPGERRARGRPRPRDVARGAQGRPGDDDRVVPGHHRGAAGQDRVLRRAVRRRPPRATTRTPCPSCSSSWRSASVVYAISFLLIRLLSRYRELSADRSGALLTGQPSALKSALIKVTGRYSQDPDQGPAHRAAAERVLLRAGRCT